MKIKAKIDRLVNHKSVKAVASVTLDGCFVVKNLRVVDVINKSLKNGLTQPRQKGISDIIGEKANDYIMHPFAWRERRKEKNLKKAKENIQKLDAAKTYEDELTEAINRQLREDSIAAAKKKMGEKK